MYWNYFGLETNPFGITPDPRYLYLSTPHSSAIEWMKMAIEQHEFGMITGEVGSGKTVLSRYLVDMLPEDKYKVAWIINPALSPVQLLKEIYTQLFEEEASRKKSLVTKELQDGLVKLFLDNKFPVVIIDEAQVIPGTKIFEELRLLSNYQTDDQNLISIILIGQPELSRKLKRRAYRAFLQRVRFTINLEPIGQDEAGEYLDHRLKVAGGNGQVIFSPEAVKDLHAITEGYPRPMNHLAGFSMMEAMSKEKKHVGSDEIISAAESILYFEESLERLKARRAK